MKLTCSTVTLLSDRITPVGVYERIRPLYPLSFLMESADHHDGSDGKSFIGIDPMASIKLEGSFLITDFPDGSRHKQFVDGRREVLDGLNTFMQFFETDDADAQVFGFMDYNLAGIFRNIPMQQGNDVKPVSLQYTFYRHVLRFDHLHDTLSLKSYHENNAQNTVTADEMLHRIHHQPVPEIGFRLHNEESTDMEDADFISLVQKARGHIQRGDVFQLVLSRGFQQSYSGDEFQVYRQLRSINPSPYLFFFDYGSFTLFGSSPELQLSVLNGKASVNPIAGTYKRSGNDEEDRQSAMRLFSDAKEQSEHTMLIDLARNDLSRYCRSVQVVADKEIQFFSHVIHMVSGVEGKLKEPGLFFDLVADSFPAGTLCGAPRHRALELIDKYEASPRGFYGGCVGAMGLNGSFSHAIMIRTFMAYHNVLHMRAGAGIVKDSDPLAEMEEVNNKLRALRNALQAAHTSFAPKQKCELAEIN